MHSAQKKGKKNACNLIHNITPRLSMQIHPTLELRSSQYPQSARKSKNCIKPCSNSIISLLPAFYSDIRMITSTICNLQSCSNTVRMFCNITSLQTSCRRLRKEKVAIHSFHSIITVHLDISATTQHCTDHAAPVLAYVSFNWKLVCNNWSDVLPPWMLWCQKKKKFCT